MRPSVENLRQFRKRAAECRMIARDLCKVAALYDRIIAKVGGLKMLKPVDLAASMARRARGRPRRWSLVKIVVEAPYKLDGRRRRAVDPDASTARCIRL